MLSKKLTKLEVARILEDFIAGADGPWGWDDFISIAIEDKYLDGIRRRCAVLDEEFPPEQKGHYCSAAGIQVIRAYIAELRDTTLKES